MSAPAPDAIARLLAAHPHGRRYAQLIDPGHPDYDPRYIAIVERLATGQPTAAPAFDDRLVRLALGCPHRLDRVQDQECGCKGALCGPGGRRAGQRVGALDCYRCAEAAESR